MDFPPLDFSKIKTFPLSERPSKVHVEDFARVQVLFDSILFPY
ncbi:MAG: hypothetical protein QM796_08530 [Chthoniobacteraceae bacterium]